MHRIIKHTNNYIYNSLLHVVFWNVIETAFHEILNFLLKISIFIFFYYFDLLVSRINF